MKLRYNSEWGEYQIRKSRYFMSPLLWSSKQLSSLAPEPLGHPSPRLLSPCLLRCPPGFSHLLGFKLCLIFRGKQSVFYLNSPRPLQFCSNGAGPSVSASYYLYCLLTNQLSLSSLGNKSTQLWVSCLPPKYAFIEDKYTLSFSVTFLQYSFRVLCSDGTYIQFDSILNSFPWTYFSWRFMWIG